jgi:2-oxoglutarate ferredoxin oxidoreductase subunit alpha
MSDPFVYPEKPIRRGKVLDEAALEKVADWGRYRDVDGDGVPWRTLPGTPGGKGAYFTRGSGHDEYARYTESDQVYARNMDRLKRKFETARTLVPAPVLDESGQRVAIIAFGTTHHAIVESRDQLLAEHGLSTDYLRIRAFPFADAVGEFLARHDRVYVVEQNRDAHMSGLLRMRYPDVSPRLRPVLHYAGLPIDARTVTDAVAEAEAKASAPRDGARKA